MACPPHSDCDVRMRMFNADGSEGEMCGNGLRCLAKFVVDAGLVRSNPVKVETGAGILTVDVIRGTENQEVTSVRVDMGRPRLLMGKIPAVVPELRSEDKVIGYKGVTFECL